MALTPVAVPNRGHETNDRQVEVAHKFATPKTLVQQYLFIPAKHKDCYLAYVLNEFAGQSTIVFVSTCNNAQVNRNRRTESTSTSLLLSSFLLLMGRYSARAAGERADVVIGRRENRRGARAVDNVPKAGRAAP